MGIKNLFKLIKKYAPKSISYKKLNSYKNNYLVLDAHMIIYQYVIAIRNSGNDLTNNDGKITSHIIGVLSKTFMLLKNNIIPIFVFDGKAPDIKKITINKRKKQKEKNKLKLENCKNEDDKLKYFKRSYYLKKNEINECKEILKLLGIPVIESPTEADPLCAILVKNNLARGILSEDMDMLTFGSPYLIRKVRGNKYNIMEIDLFKILKELEINMDQFIDLSILLGCDYLPKIKGIGFIRAYNIIKKYNNIENFLENDNKVKSGFYKIPENYNYKIVQNYFKNPMNNIIDCKINFNKPKYNLIKKILNEKYNFKQKNINIYISNIKKYYNLLSSI